jgi:hypothetical protein
MPWQIGRDGRRHDALGGMECCVRRAHAREGWSKWLLPSAGRASGTDTGAASERMLCPGIRGGSRSVPTLLIGSLPPAALARTDGEWWASVETRERIAVQ